MPNCFWIETTISVLFSDGKGNLKNDFNQVPSYFSQKVQV